MATSNSTTSQRAVSRNLKIGEALIIIVPLIIWVGGFSLKSHDTLVIHEDRLGVLEKGKDKTEQKLDDLQKGINDIKLLLKDKVDRK
jgi:hypothetical protein